MSQEKKLEGNIFKKLSLVSLVAVYILILVGGIVRSTGSGMGCPDWPKCFGNWVPPTDKSELPENYKEIYSSMREVKNQKFAKQLKAIGFNKQADRIINDKNILVETDFNLFKTWTEYINRLIGAVIGLLIFMTFLSSLKYIKHNKNLVIISFITLIAVAFQGWVGSIVVSTNLMPWLITFHMLMALLIVALLTIQYHKVSPTRETEKLKNNRLTWLLVACMAAMVIQIVAGTQVRESIDMIAAGSNFGLRNSWIEQLGPAFYFHRSFSILILILHVYLLFMLKSQLNWGNTLITPLFGLVCIEIILGVIMAYFSIPAIVQPFHLLLATIIFGLQFMLLLELNFSFLIKNVKYQF